MIKNAQKHGCMHEVYIFLNITEHQKGWKYLDSSLMTPFMGVHSFIDWYHIFASSFYEVISSLFVVWYQHFVYVVVKSRTYLLSVISLSDKNRTRYIELTHCILFGGIKISMPKKWVMLGKWYSRADSRLPPSQWETSLQSNAVSHWLGANPESAMI